MSGAEAIRVIALNGSPHRDGNTATLMSWVAEGCTEAGAEVEWINLADLKIGYCRGCNSCLRLGRCVIGDDLQPVFDRLLAADGIIAGSPVYANDVTAQMKTLMDRLTLLNLYLGVFDRQQSAGVATSGIAPAGGVAKKAASFFGCRSGIVTAKTASLKHGYRGLRDYHDPKLPGKAKKLGRRLVADIRGRSTLRPPPVSHVYIGLLRKHLLRRFVVMKHPDMFAAVIKGWEERSGRKP